MHSIAIHSRLHRPTHSVHPTTIGTNTSSKRITSRTRCIRSRQRATEPVSTQTAAAKTTQPFAVVASRQGTVDIHILCHAMGAPRGSHTARRTGSGHVLQPSLIFQHFRGEWDVLQRQHRRNVPAGRQFRRSTALTHQQGKALVALGGAHRIR